MSASKEMEDRCLEADARHAAIFQENNIYQCLDCGLVCRGKDIEIGYHSDSFDGRLYFCPSCKRSHFSPCLHKFYKYECVFCRISTTDVFPEYPEIVGHEDYKKARIALDVLVGGLGLPKPHVYVEEGEIVAEWCSTKYRIAVCVHHDCNEVEIECFGPRLTFWACWWDWDTVIPNRLKKYAERINSGYQVPAR